MRLRFGEKIRPVPVIRENDADNIWGPGWHARRTAEGGILGYVDGGLVARECFVSLSRNEWEQLSADSERFLSIVQAHEGRSGQ